MLAGFNEKTGEARPGTINGGVYLMSRNCLSRFRQVRFPWRMR